jgi:methionine biosynthesis protein MetW
MSENYSRKGYTGGRPDILALLTNSVERVLDVGCSTGTLGRSIKEIHGARVTGIELDKRMALVAKNQLNRVLVGDAEKIFEQGQLKDEKFDVIIFADILEHLINPWRVLSLATEHLSEHGMIIASIPNIRFFNSLFNVAVLGRWPYRDRGIHDRTHLRFFTLKNIQELFDQAGLVIENQTANYRIIERPHGVNRYAKYLALPGVRNFLAYQYLIRAKKVDLSRK